MLIMQADEYKDSRLELWIVIVKVCPKLNGRSFDFLLATHATRTIVIQATGPTSLPLKSVLVEDVLSIIYASD